MKFSLYVLYSGRLISHHHYRIKFKLSTITYRALSTQRPTIFFLIAPYKGVRLVHLLLRCPSCYPFTLLPIGSLLPPLVVLLCHPFPLLPIGSLLPPLVVLPCLSYIPLYAVFPSQLGLPLFLQPGCFTAMFSLVVDPPPSAPCDLPNSSVSFKYAQTAQIVCPTTDVPKTKLSLAKCTFSVAAPQIRNELPSPLNLQKL